MITSVKPLKNLVSKSKVNQWTSVPLGAKARARNSFGIVTQKGIIAANESIHLFCSICTGGTISLVFGEEITL